MILGLENYGKNLLFNWNKKYGASPQSTEIRAKIKREWIAQGGNAATSELEI